MPNIGIHGYRKQSIEICKRIISCMDKIGFKNDGVVEIFYTQVWSCDSKYNDMPYLRIFSSDFEHIPQILKGFEEHKIYEDVEVLGNPNMFFEAKQIKDGHWREQFSVGC